VLQAEDTHVIVLERFPKKEKGEHIKGQVHEIGVDEPAGKEAPVLVFYGDGRGPEDQGVCDPVVVKGYERNNAGKDYDAYCEACHQDFL
jgi:hypothetical protein